MKIPEEFNYAEAFLTFRCGMGCSYCINDVGGINRERDELSAEQWANAINKFDWHLPLTLGGGEPTKHKEFYKILDLIKPEVNLELLTNLTFDVRKFLRNTTPERFTQKDNAYKSIRVSFHPEKHEPKGLVRKARELQDAGFKVGIFGLNHPANMIANTQMAEYAREKQVYFFIKDFLGEIDGHKFGFLKYQDSVGMNKGKKVSCKTKDILISPEGNVYKCHRDLYHQQYELGNIQNDFKFEHKFRDCSDYGLCNPCDVKQRTNRFLQMGDCNVEIKSRMPYAGCRDRGFSGGPE